MPDNRNWILMGLRMVMGNIVRLVLITLVMLSVRTAAANEQEWGDFKQRFVSPEGRVVDPLQEEASHSEGQGFAMLFAVYYGDSVTFRKLWQWTQQHLQVREDKLLSWRWLPGSGVTDKNNASDGDLLVAWALLRAAEKWHEAAYLKSSQEIAHDIREKLLRRTDHGLILLPGNAGFDKSDGITINLSYWVFPALRDLPRADPSPEWGELTRSGISILGYARFGRWGLPPDWLQLGDKVRPADGYPERFSYNAVRIPLYLLWAGLETDDLLMPYRKFWGYFSTDRYLPAWTNLIDDSVDSYDASTGIHAIAQWVLALPEKSSVGSLVNDGQQGYYSSALLLLTRMAAEERAGNSR